MAAVRLSPAPPALRDQERVPFAGLEGNDDLFARSCRCRALQVAGEQTHLLQLLTHELQEPCELTEDQRPIALRVDLGDELDDLSKLPRRHVGGRVDEPRMAHQLAQVRERREDSTT